MIRSVLHRCAVGLGVLALVGSAVAAELNGGAIVTRTALRNAPSVFAEKGKGRIAFLGGSITEGNYFRPIVQTDLQQRFPSATLSFTVAGLSSTCSTSGAFRFQEDILAKGVPDVLFVEFAVNDDQDGFGGHSYDDCVHGMEGIVRQARRANPKMDIVMILFTNANELSLVRQGQTPVPYAGHLAVAEHYGIPTINVAKALVNAEAAGTFSWQAYGADCHPNTAGSQFGADLVSALLTDQGWGSTTPTAAAYTLPALLDAGSWDRGCWIDPMSVTRGAGWNFSTPDWATLTGCRSNYVGQDILWSTTPGSTCSFKFTGTAISAFILAGKDAGMLEISVDGDDFVAYDLYSSYSSSLQYPYTRVFRQGLADGEHTAVFRVGASKNGASTGTAVRLFRVGVNGTPDVARPVVSTSGVVWAQPRDVAGDADVVTQGVLRYAYGVMPSNFKGTGDFVIGGMTVNGVYFPGHSTGTAARGEDLTFTGFTGSYNNSAQAWAGGLATSSTLTVFYKALLGCGMLSSTVGGTGTITFRRLVPGRRYLIQLWCNHGTTALSGEKVTIDGVADLTTGDPDGAARGQYVTGTFRAKDTTLTISIKGNSSGPFFNAVQLRDISSDAPIAWGVAKDCTADADVETTGVLRYAYAGNAVTINGVPFAGTFNAYYSPNGNVEGADLACTGFTSLYTGTSTFCKSFTATATMTSAYQKLVGGCLSTPLWGTATLTLKNLLPNHTYLVQLWVNDTRETPGNVRSERIDDGPTLRFRRSNGLGQYVTGTFIATSESRTISFTPFTDSSVQSASQVNAIQVRDLTPGIIAWEQPKNVTADSDVRTDGDLLYAYTLSDRSVEVNGVLFRKNNTSAQGLGKSITLSDDVALNNSAFSQSGYATANVSANYTYLLRGSVFTESGNIGLRLNGLVTGARYLVQIWTNDSRGDGPYRNLIVDGGCRLCERASGNFGQHVTGTFTAEATTHDIRLSQGGTVRKENGFLATQINSIQVRRIGGGPSATIEWHGTEISQFDPDVRNDGTLLYAYTMSGSTATMNGVSFAAAGASPKTDVNGDLGFANMTGGFNCFFDATDTASSAGYHVILKNAWSSSNSQDATVTLKRLVPGHRYLVQLWVNDFRNTPGLVRYQTLDDSVDLSFKKTTGAPSRGDYAVGLFTASAATQLIYIKSKTRSSVASAAQVNAIQVRDLGALEGVTTGVNEEWISESAYVKTGVGTATLPASDPVPSTVIAGKGALSLARADGIAEGGDLIVQAPASVTLASGASPVLSRLCGTGTLDFSGTLELANVGVAAFDGTLNGSVTVRKTGAADYFLGGTCTGALALDAQSGCTWLKATAANGLTLAIAAEASVDLAAQTKALTRVAGDGTLMDGTLTGTTTMTGALKLADVSFADEAGLVLEGASTLAFAGTADLDGVSIRLADPQAIKTAGLPFLTVEEAFLGEPEFTYGKNGYRAELTEDGKGYTLAYIGAMQIFIR